MSYKLVASSGAEALSKAFADQTKKVLTAAQDIKAQNDNAAEKAKTDAKKALQDAASQHMRELAQENLIFAKDQEIAAQEIVVTRSRAARDKAQAKLSALPANAANDTERAALEAASTALDSAHDKLSTDEAQLAKLKNEKRALEKQLDALKAGLSTTSGASSD